MRIIPKGATSQSVFFTINDNTSAIAGKKTGLLFNSSGIKAYYTRIDTGPVQIQVAGALVTQTPTGAWTAAGFVEMGSANAPGLYRLDPPDAAFATGVNSVVFSLFGATGMVQSDLEIQLDGMTDNIIEGTYTFKQMMRLLAAAILGKSSGLSTGAPIFRDTADAKNRITATTTSDGRSAVTLDPT